MGRKLPTFTLNRTTEMTKLEQAISELWNREQEFVEATQDAPEKEHAFDQKWAIEFLKADGSVESRKATATKNCSAESLENLRAKARARIAGTKLTDALAALSARQSLHTSEFRANQAFSRNQV